jgi:Flp pilus assembly protein TadG
VISRLRRLARLRKACAGTTAIEFAILLPAFLLLLLGVVEFGRMIWTQVSLQQAVEAAARCLSVAQCTSSNAPSYAVEQAYGLSVPASDFTVSSPSCGVEVSASYPFGFVVPSLFPWQVTLTAQSCYPLQS